MTPEDVFVWQRDQDELVDGHPVPRHRMMTGAAMQHDRATVNVIGRRGSGDGDIYDGLAFAPRRDFASEG